MEKLYTAVATATGGRNGKVKSSDGILDLEVRMPKALGGANDNYTNPEQLFAAGYSACFDSALKLVIKMAKVTTGETSVKAAVSIGKIENGGFGIGVELFVNVPGVEQAKAEELVHQAHQVCPYSNATRGNIDVAITVTTEG